MKQRKVQQMKYDSGMKQFHNDIIAALRYMLKNDKDITEKFCPGDGSPAPLRDYLKQKYGSTYHGAGSPNVTHYNCKPQGFEVFVNSVETLTLSWSQAAKFIRDNWDEVFKKGEAQETPELPPSKPTYKDIFLEHYPNFDVSRFDEFAESLCVDCCFDDRGGGTCPFPVNGECKTHWESECLYKWRDIVECDIGTINEFLIEKQPESETAEDTAKTENQLIPQSAEEISETFNYAVLSAEMGDYLKRKEQQLKNEYMNFTANCGAIFAEVQEKLAKDGHGTFIKWIESMGFKSATVYRMIDVNKFRLSLIEKDEKETQEIFDALPKYLQYDISAKSAPAELVEQVLNGDITTHKDYIALKKQLDEAKSRTEQAGRLAEIARQENEKNSAKLAAEAAKVGELERRIKELESRPVDVAVQRDDTSLAEIERLKNELAKAQQELIDASFKNTASGDTELVSDFYETLHGSALSAIRSCADFAEKNGGRFTSRFRSLAEVINDYINEMEEF